MRQLGKEELESKLAYFAESFEFKTNKRLDLSVVEQYLNDELSRIESQLIKEAFNNMSHESIRALLSIIGDKKNSYAKDKKHKKNL